MNINFIYFRSAPYSEETFVAASLENGELFVRLQFNQTSEAYTVGGNRLDNGFNHLIQVSCSLFRPTIILRI